jgi:predicted MFS family arabinose efflux permease
VGGLIGWRGAFFSVVPLALATLIWQAVTLPRLPVKEAATTGGMWALFRNRHFSIGMLAVMLAFMGQFTLFTYLRPFLEQVTGVGVSMLSGLLLVVGATGFVGTTMVGRFLDGRLNTTLAVIPLGMAGAAVAMAWAGRSTGGMGVLLGAWGVLSAAGPVAWSTWLTRTVPDDAEAGGGLMVAIIQLGITVGATAGGAVFDARGAVTTIAGASVILLLASAAAYAASHVHQRTFIVKPIGPAGQKGDSNI